MDFLPIFMNIRHRSCLVVGGGAIATRKVSLLLQAEASVTVVAPNLEPTLQAERDAERIQHRQAYFSVSDLDGHALVIAATNNQDVNRQVSELCQARLIPVNVVDQPSLCSFIMPAIVDRAPLTIAISSGGNAPVLSRLLRGRLESLIPTAYGQLAQLAADFRARVKQVIPAVQRRTFWEGILQGPISELMLSGRKQEAYTRLEALLAQGATADVEMGEVYLVGGGPGDPDLLTFRALRLMQQADVVVYDRLVSPAVLDLTRRDAERIYAGKKPGEHILPQTEINRLLVDLAKAGQRVLRLKGGDPFIFGRGGEELETLAQAGIPFQVVPGITAASGCAAYAGIPLTHRDYAQSCVFVSGHRQDGSLSLPWESLLHPEQTVVFYMGLQSLSAICQGLIKRGRSAATPAALVEQGTLPNQQVYVADLATITERAEAAQIQPPCLLIVGEVVKLHGALQWFGQHDL
ncbi:MAG: siroheme synthase CysG [Candidatus Competibacteraceae bacterium]|jgi:uroporphyrin-III C-methyltransferase/precorrin-2 dehydrogenase/sirohydrochlorin ferrochelatase|nr:siroheme synthase CysG [Candidatus Competibacteraceae bacterium]